MRTLTGLGVAMITPFSKDFKIDYAAAERLVEHLIAGGTDFLLALGTTGEPATLSEQERANYLRFVIERTNGRKPVIVGVGGNNTQAVVDAIAKLPKSGIEAVLSVAPYYNKPTQRGIIQHFKTIAQHSHLPIIVYNVPGRTGVNMTAETTLELAHSERNIVPVKEAAGNISQMGYILRDRPKDFVVLSGDDNLLLPELAIGADGVISVFGNAFPQHFARLIALAREQRYPDAAVLHGQLLHFIDLLFAEGNPCGIKAAMTCLGIAQNVLRLPLVPISDTLMQKMQREVDALSAISA